MADQAEKYTDEELEGLTAEEREALQDEETAGDGEGGDDDAGKTGAEGDDADGGEGDDTGDGDGAEGKEGDPSGEEEDAAKKGDGEGEGDGEEEGKAEDTADRPGYAEQPLITPADIEKADERLEAISTEKKDLNKKFDDGDLTGSEYQDELDRLNREERQIEQAKFKTQISSEMQQQQAKNDWLRTVNDFLDDNPDYREKPLLYRTLDAAVRDIAADEANQDLTGKQILQKAHDQIVEQLGVGGAKQETDAGEGEGKEQEPAKSKGDQRKPRTLANLPASEATEVENSKWTKLDRLQETDPERYEAEVAKMSDSERDAYLASQ